MSLFPIIDKLGGREAVHEKLAARGFTHSVHALRMWEARKSLPGDAIVLLLKIAEDEEVETISADLEPVAEQSGKAA